jgi:DNA-binding GntR family transcriptional regulator
MPNTNAPDATNPADEIYKALRDEIFAGKLNPGERLWKRE